MAKKRELELENARLRGQIEVLERELSAARVGGTTVWPIYTPPVVPCQPNQPFSPWYSTPTTTCGLDLPLTSSTLVITQPSHAEKLYG